MCHLPLLPASSPSSSSSSFSSHLNLSYVPPSLLSPSPSPSVPSAAPSIYKRSRSEFLKRHFHVPCVSLSPPSPPPPLSPSPHFPILRTSGELSDDKSFKSSIPFSLSLSLSLKSSSLSLLRVIVAIMKLDSARRIQMPPSPPFPPSLSLPPLPLPRVLSSTQCKNWPRNDNSAPKL